MFVRAVLFSRNTLPVLLSLSKVCQSLKNHSQIFPDYLSLLGACQRLTTTYLMHPHPLPAEVEYLNILWLISFRSLSALLHVLPGNHVCEGVFCALVLVEWTRVLALGQTSSWALGQSPVSLWLYNLFLGWPCLIAWLVLVYAYYPSMIISNIPFALKMHWFWW